MSKTEIIFDVYVGSDKDRELAAEVLERVNKNLRIAKKSPCGIEGVVEDQRRLIEYFRNPRTVAGDREAAVRESALLIMREINPEVKLKIPI